MKDNIQPNKYTPALPGIKAVIPIITKSMTDKRRSCFLLFLIYIYI